MTTVNGPRTLYSAIRSIFPAGSGALKPQDIALAASFVAGCSSGECKGIAAVATCLCAAGIFSWMGRFFAGKTEIPDPIEVVTNGISEIRWRGIKKYLISRRNREVVVDGETLYKRSGQPFAFNDRAAVEKGFNLNRGAARKVMYAWWAVGEGKGKIVDHDDIDATLAKFDRLAGFFGNNIERPLSATAGLDLSQEASDLVARVVRYHETIWELADIFEPMLIQRYFIQKGKIEAAETMGDVVKNRTGKISREKLAHLFSDHLHDRGQISDEARLVECIEHLYFARRGIDVARKTQSPVSRIMAIRIAYENYLVGNDLLLEFANNLCAYGELEKEPFVTALENHALGIKRDVRVEASRAEITNLNYCPEEFLKRGNRQWRYVFASMAEEIIRLR